MPRCKGVVRTFAAAGKTGNSIKLAQGTKLLPSTGEQFVGIGLVPDIPDDLIPGGVENVMNRNCPFSFSGIPMSSTSATLAN